MDIIPHHHLTQNLPRPGPHLYQYRGYSSIGTSNGGLVPFSFLPPTAGQISPTHTLRQPANVLLQSIIVSLQFLVAGLHVLDFLDQGGEAGLVFECGTMQCYKMEERVMHCLIEIVGRGGQDREKRKGSFGQAGRGGWELVPLYLRPAVNAHRFQVLVAPARAHRSGVFGGVYPDGFGFNFGVVGGDDHGGGGLAEANGGSGCLLAGWRVC